MQNYSLNGLPKLFLFLALVGSTTDRQVFGNVGLATDGSQVDHFWSSSEGTGRTTYALEESAGTSRVAGDASNASVTVFDYRLIQANEHLQFTANSYAAREAGNSQSDAFVTFMLRFQVDEPMIYRLDVQRTAAQGLYFALGETDMVPFEVYLGFDAERYRTEDHTSQGTLSAGDYSLVSLNRATEFDFETIPGNESQVAYNFEVHAADVAVQPVPEPLTILATVLALGFGIGFRRMTVAK